MAWTTVTLNSTTYIYISLLAFQHGTTVNTMAWYHSQHHGMVPCTSTIYTIWQDRTVNTMAWHHYQHNGMISLLTLYGMVPLRILSTLWHDTTINTIRCMLLLMLWHGITINTML